MIARPRHRRKPMDSCAETLLSILLITIDGVLEIFRPRPRPSGARIVSGIAPAGDGSARPLSGAELQQLDAWFALHQDGWRRNPLLPPAGSSYGGVVTHSNGEAALLLL